DSDDADPAFFPGAAEDDCTDPTDYNCDGSVAWADDDGDGWAACEACDDLDAAVHPGAEERCNGVDDDCDGVVDATDRARFEADADGDGFTTYEDGWAEGCEAPAGLVVASLVRDCDD